MLLSKIKKDANSTTNSHLKRLRHCIHHISGKHVFSIINGNWKLLLYTYFNQQNRHISATI